MFLVIDKNCKNITKQEKVVRLLYQINIAQCLKV